MSCNKRKENKFKLISTANNLSAGASLMVSVKQLSTTGNTLHVENTDGTSYDLRLVNDAVNIKNATGLTTLATVTKFDL